MVHLYLSCSSVQVSTTSICSLFCAFHLWPSLCGTFSHFLALHSAAMPSPSGQCIFPPFFLSCFSVSISSSFLYSTFSVFNLYLSLCSTSRHFLACYSVFIPVVRLFFFSALSFLVTLSQSHHCLCVVVHVVPDISGSPSAVKLEAILVLWYVFFAFSILATPSKPHLCFCIVCFMPFLSGPPSALCIMHFSALSCCSILSSSLSLEQALFVSP